MALVKSVAHYEGVDTTGQQNRTTTSFTPSNDSLLVAFITMQSDFTSAEWNQSASGGGLDWNFLGEWDPGTGSAYKVKGFAYYAKGNTTATSMTFTFSTDGYMNGTQIMIYDFTGYDTSDPIGGIYADGALTSRSGSYNGTLSTTPAASSYIVSAAVAQSATITEPSDWTVDQTDTTYSTIDGAYVSTTGQTSDEVIWQAITTSDSWASLAVEVKSLSSSLTLDFPSSPSNGDRFNQNGMTYYYYGGAWRKIIPSRMKALSYGIDNSGATGTTMTATNLLNYEGAPGSSPISLTTTSFTPSSDVVLVAVVGFSDINSSNHTDNTTLTSTGGVTWTKVSGTTINIGPRSSLYVSAEIYIAEIGTSPGSITATHTRTGTRGSASCSVNIHIHEVSGYKVGDPTGAVMAEEDTTQDGAVSGTLSATPASGSLVIGSRVADASSATALYADPGTNWTELSDFSNNYYWCSVQCQYRVMPGTTDQVSWEDVAVNNTIDVTSELVGVEILQGGAALNTGIQGTVHVPYDFNIIRWTLIGDQSGDANVDLWSCEYGTDPTQGNSMTDNIGMTISAATANQSGDIDSWRMKRINAGNVVTYSIQSCSTITRMTVNLFGEEG